MTFDESENLFFRVYKLEDLIKGIARIVDLVNLENKIMRHGY